MKNNLYIAFTPYHIFLASLIAVARGNESNILIVISDFEADRIVKSIEKSKIFKECILLDGLYGKVTHRNSIRKNNAEIICQYINQCERLDTLFLGMDTRIETQSAAAKTKKNFPNAVISVIEDGGNFYNSDMGSKPKNILKVLHSKICIGSWFEDIKISGLYSKTEELYVIFPELIREEIREKKVNAISCESLNAPLYQAFIEEYWNNFRNKREELLWIDGILVIAYFGFANRFPQYVVLIREICKKLAENGFKIIVKYHPREEADDYCGLSSFKNVTFFPKEIPAEFFYVLKDNKLKFVIGDISSALMTAKWILKDTIRIYSVAPVLQVNDQRLFDFFKKIKINLIDNISNIRIGKNEQLY